MFLFVISKGLLWQQKWEIFQVTQDVIENTYNRHAWEFAATFVDFAIIANDISSDGGKNTTAVFIFMKCRSFMKKKFFQKSHITNTYKFQGQLLFG